MTNWFIPYLPCTWRPRATHVFIDHNWFCHYSSSLAFDVSNTYYFNSIQFLYFFVLFVFIFHAAFNSKCNDATIPAKFVRGMNIVFVGVFVVVFIWKLCEWFAFKRFPIQSNLFKFNRPLYVSTPKIIVRFSRCHSKIQFNLLFYIESLQLMLNIIYGQFCEFHIM